MFLILSRSYSLIGSLGSSPGISVGPVSVFFRMVGDVTRIGDVAASIAHFLSAIRMCGRRVGDLKGLRGDTAKSCANRVLCAKPASIPVTTASLTFFCIILIHQSIHCCRALR